MERSFPSLFVFVVLAAGLQACTPAGEPAADEVAQASTPKLVFVTGGATPFWDIAVAGANAAGSELDAEVETQVPESAAEQNQMLRTLLSQDIDGVAVSPMNPSGQRQLLDQLASRANLVTHDSDAPQSHRLAFVGVDNYAAGRLCGQLVKQALPVGGNLAIFVGRLEQLNAQQRRQGLIDELLDVPIDEEKRAFERYFPAHRYPKSGSIEGDRYTIVGTFTDDLDMAEADKRVEEALTEHPNLGGIVGLFSYNIPVALGVLERLGRSGDIEMVAFDEADETLQGIQDGAVFGTVVQNPYRYGYDSIRILADLARGDRSVLPEQGFLDVPARQVTAENVDAFRGELRELTGSE